MWGKGSSTERVTSLDPLFHFYPRHWWFYPRQCSHAAGDRLLYLISSHIPQLPVAVCRTPPSPTVPTSERRLPLGWRFRADFAHSFFSRYVPGPCLLLFYIFSSILSKHLSASFTGVLGSLDNSACACTLGGLAGGTASAYMLGAFTSGSGCAVPLWVKNP